MLIDGVSKYIARKTLISHYSYSLHILHDSGQTSHSLSQFFSNPNHKHQLRGAVVDSTLAFSPLWRKNTAGGVEDLTGRSSGCASSIIDHDTSGANNLSSGISSRSDRGSRSSSSSSNAIGRIRRNCLSVRSKIIEREAISTYFQWWLHA